MNEANFSSILQKLIENSVLSQKTSHSNSSQRNPFSAHVFISIHEFSLYFHRSLSIRVASIHLDIYRLSKIKESKPRRVNFFLKAFALKPKMKFISEMKLKLSNSLIEMLS